MTDVDDPSYYEFITKSTESLTTYIAELDVDRNLVLILFNLIKFEFCDDQKTSLTAESMYESVTTNWHFKLSDMIAPIIIAIVIFALRKVIELVLLKLTENLQFKNEAERHKLPESVFFVLMYGSFWLWELKIVLMEYDFFIRPSSCFTNWSEIRLQKTPETVNRLYVTVQGFYLQALFSCIMIGQF